jgi:hypothetical protein
MGRGLAIATKSPHPIDAAAKRGRRLPDLVGDRAAWQPEKRLMVAVLQDAAVTLLDNATRHSGRARRLCAETSAWFDADDEGAPFSLVNICDAVQLDVGRVRAWIAGRVADLRLRRAEIPPRRRTEPGD